ncbi:MAG: toprim domain-containing protein, partial [Selenomonadaceae bacterium]|nr:toprim domain-containing protein [Selenomonadaceae bacterium]
IKARPYIKEKLHAGRKKLFNPDVLTCTEPIFCFEGYIDAMSAELAGFKAVALGGRGEGDLLVAAVDNLKPKPHIIILFDNDSAGREAAPQLRADLLAVKCPCVVRFLSKPTIDNDDSDCDSGAAVMSTNKIDANDILQKQGVDVLRVMLQEIIDDSLSELNAVETELAKKDSAGLSDDDWDFIFNGDGSDLDFARALEIFYGANVRWLTDDERWAIYNSGVWRIGSEKSSCIAPFARKLADVMLQNADDKDERDLAHALKSSKKIGSVVTMLKSIDSILISAADRDKHPNLLNVKNGVIDLETGKLLAADPSLYLTQQANIDFDPRADSAFIEKFFEEIQPDEMTRRGLLRWLGYNLTGSVREEKFLVWLGESGANGKGVLSRTLAALLRDYAAALPRTALVLRKFDDGNAHTAALNALINARFAISEELPQNATLDSALLKTLTGGDMQPFRRLREEFKDSEPTAKINMSSNFIPKFENADDCGIKRRLLVMPFNVTFTDDKADPHLKEKMLLPENQRGFLRILVDEAVSWYKDGLIISPQMLETTRENLNANDFISDFLYEFCDVGFGKGEVPRKVLLDKLREKYPQAHKFNDRDLCKMIERRGIEYKRGMHGFIFKGIRLLTDDDFTREPIDDYDEETISQPSIKPIAQKEYYIDPDDLPFDD